MHSQTGDLGQRESDTREGGSVGTAESGNEAVSADTMREETVVSHGTGNRSRGDTHTGGTN